MGDAMSTESFDCPAAEAEETYSRACRISKREDAAYEAMEQEAIDCMRDRTRLKAALRSIRDVDQTEPHVALEACMGIAAVALAEVTKPK